MLRSPPPFHPCLVGLKTLPTGEHLVTGSLPTRSAQQRRVQTFLRPSARLNNARPNRCPPSLVKPDLSSRAACRRKGGKPTFSGYLSGAFAVSQATRRTSQRPDLWDVQVVAETLIFTYFLTTCALHPTTAGADGDVGTFTPLPGWAVHHTTGRESCRRKPAHAERTQTHFHFCTPQCEAQQRTSKPLYRVLSNLPVEP